MKKCHTYAIDDFLSQILGGTQLSKFDLEHSLLVQQVTALGFINIVHTLNMIDDSNAKLLVVMCNVDTRNMTVLQRYELIFWLGVSGEAEGALGLNADI